VRILFVCNANIVRSFMAERLLKSKLQRSGVHDVEVSSAGLLDMHGAPADPTASRILRDNGIDDEGHQSRMVNEDLVEAADLIVTMEQGQLQRIGDQYPSVRDRVRLLKSYVPDQKQGGAAEDIKDPYRRSIFDYRLCFAEISLAMEELRKCI
jgi:protein-tyrosine phosphatase